MEERITLNVLNNGYTPNNCFEFYSDNDITISYHRRGLQALHQGYSAEDDSSRLNLLLKAFGYFNLALSTEPSNFCAREGIRKTAELLEGNGIGEIDKIVDSEEYAIQMSENPHPGVCHLVHPEWSEK